MKQSQKQEIQNLLNLISYNITDYTRSLPAAKDLLDILFKAYTEEDEIDSFDNTYRQKVFDKLFNGVVANRQITFYNTLRNEKGLECALVIPDNVLNQVKSVDTYDFMSMALCNNYDYYLKEENSEDKLFIHFTKPECVESILKNGLVGLEKDTLSFGSKGIYFYEFNDSNNEFWESFSEITAIVFRLPDKFYKCIADLTGEGADGTNKYPAYCYYTKDIPVEYIIGKVSSLEEIKKLANPEVKSF